MSKKGKIIEDARALVEMYQHGYLDAWIKALKIRRARWRLWKEIQEECRLDFEKSFKKIFSKKEVRNGNKK